MSGDEMTADWQGVRVAEDDRGRLVAVELPGTGVDVRRIFVVTGAPGGAERGGHEVPCTQRVVLLTGSAVFWVRSPGAPERETRLARAGEQLTLRTGDWVRYLLPDDRSQILVLADAPYDGSGR